MQDKDLELMKKMLAQGIREVKIMSYFIKAGYDEPEVLSVINKVQRQVEIEKMRKDMQ